MRGAIVHPGPAAAVARDAVLGACVLQRQLTPAAVAADQPGEECVAMLGRAVMPAGGNVAADHFADRLRPLPAYVSFVRIRHQRQPISPRLATDLHADAIGAVSRCSGSLTIGIGPAVDRVLDHPVDGGVVGTPPGRGPVVLLHRQIEIVLMEPAQRLPRAAKLLHLVEDQRDRLLHTPIWILLIAVAGPSRSPPAR